jgi:hypothetical protein
VGGIGRGIEGWQKCEMLYKKLTNVQKGLGLWLKWYNTYLASVRLKVHTPVTQLFIYERNR